MRDDYDRSSKWLIQHRGDAILRLAGVRDIRSWRPLQPEVVQPKQLPDGLLEVQLADQAESNLYVVEIATYPEERIQEQVLRDATLVFLDRRILPEVLILVLCSRGNVPVAGTQELLSPRGWTRWQASCRVVELWTLSAEQLLAADDVGLVPWIPLTHFDGPPEPLLQECRERIDRQSPPEERDNWLAVAQVLTRLRYNDRQLLSIFGGRQAMIQSPLIQELMAERAHKDIVTALMVRFRSVPQEIVTALQTIQDEQQLDELMKLAVGCPDLDAFHSRLSSLNKP